MQYIFHVCSSRTRIGLPISIDLPVSELRTQKQLVAGAKQTQKNHRVKIQVQGKPS
jgi:hypothetical protein